MLLQGPRQTDHMTNPLRESFAHRPRLHVDRWRENWCTDSKSVSLGTSAKPQHRQHTSRTTILKWYSGAIDTTPCSARRVSTTGCCPKIYIYIYADLYIYICIYIDQRGQATILHLYISGTSSLYIYVRYIYRCRSSYIHRLYKVGRHNLAEFRSPPPCVIYI